ncbi:MAG TPA: hypothetical protein VGO11_05230 [Chthoniobacteraceae bacterium]|nr:hypothetical protein [Chthoniobacteraceae bacterium]
MKYRSSLEALESRIAPAGLVKVTVTAGVLNLEGDAAANDLTIEATYPGLIAITGNNGTMISFANVTDVSAHVDVPVTALTGDLGADDDVLTVNYLNLSKGVTLTDSVGKNSFSFTDLRLGGDLSITTGGGDDSITLLGSTFTAKGVKLNPGDGANQTFLYASEINAASLTYTGGIDADAVTKNTQGEMAIAGPLSLNMGAGANDVEFTAGTLVAKGAVNIQHGTHSTGTSITNLFPNIAQYKSTLTISYVDGTNTTVVSATYDVSTVGLLKITGGSGPDTVALNGGNVTYKAAVSIAGGGGDDTITLTGSNVTYGSGVTVAGGAGTNSLTVQPTYLTAKTLTYLGGSDNDTVTLNGNSASFSGLVSVTLGDGVNSFNNANYDSLNGGLSVTGGTGVDTVTLGGYLTAKSITLRLGDGADVLSHNGSYLSVSGMADYGMGDGANTINGYFYSANYYGGLKVTAGVGDDNLGINAQNLTLAKGATLDGGLGANSLGMNGTFLDSAGDLSFTNGAHGAGTSSVSVSFTNVSLQKGVTAKFGDGAESFNITGGSSVSILGGVTVTAPGTGATTVNLNGPSFSMAGKLTVTGGSDGFSVGTSVGHLNLGSVQLTGGTGSDTVNLGGEGQIGAMTLALGAGASNISIQGQHDGLTIKGALNITAASAASGDNDYLTLANLIVTGATTIVQGAGTGYVTIDNILAAALSINTGAGNDIINFETSNSGIVSVVTGAVNILLGSGSDTVTIGNNLDLAKASFKSTVKINGGTENDVFNDNGNIYVIPSVFTQ